MSRKALFVLALTASFGLGTMIHYGLQPDASLPVPLSAPRPPMATPAPAMIPHAEQIRSQMNRPPTAEEQKEDARVDAEQVRAAALDIESVDMERRLAGTEQLSAYPTRDAERLLAKLLASDPEPKVRAAAAQGLDSFERITQETIAALLSGLDDIDEDVQLNALSTLENLATKQDNDSARYKKLMGALRSKAKSPRLLPETRKALREFIQDQSS